MLLDYHPSPRPSSPRTGRATSVAVVNRKGGVMKTSTALGLAFAWAEQGLEVLLVDVDPHANLTDALPAPTPQRTVADLLLAGFAAQWPDPPDAAAAVAPTAWPGLSLLPAPPADERSPLLFAETLISAHDRQQGHLRLDRALEGLRDRFDLIVIDSPPQVSSMVWCAVGAADHLVVSFKPERHAIRGFAALDAMVAAARADGALRAEVVGAVGYGDFRQVITRTAVAELEAAGLPVLRPLVPLSVARTAQAQEARRPLAALWPDDPIAVAYRQLAEQLRQRMGVAG